MPGKQYKIKRYNTVTDKQCKSTGYNAVLDKQFESNGGITVLGSRRVKSNVYVQTITVNCQITSQFKKNNVCRPGHIWRKVAAQSDHLPPEKISFFLSQIFGFY